MRCPNRDCLDGKVVVELAGGRGTVTRDCSACAGFAIGRGELRANPPAKKAKRARRRKNPPALAPLAPAAAAELLRRIRAGARVRLLVPNGIGRRGVEWKAVSGRAVMPAEGGGWVVNLGGAHGRPAIVTAANIVDVLGGAARTNPAPATITVRQFTSKAGHLVGYDVLAVEYFNVGSDQQKPYRHDFEQGGVEMWALADGSILFRHPKYRLWDDFVVPDGE